MADQHASSEPAPVEIDDEAERTLRRLRNIGVALLVAAAFADVVEEAVYRWRGKARVVKHKALRRVDSRSAQVASVAVAMIESALPGTPRPRH